MKNVQTSQEAMDLLMASVQHILDSGFDVTGIDPSQVRIRRRDLPEDEALELEPSGDGPDPVPVTARGYTGNLSVCCGAPTEAKGTCEYCLSCGGSNGCS